MAQLFLNNCYGVLDTPATASDTTLVLTQMHGFPDTMGEGDWFTLTVFADSSRYGVNIEVVKVTAIDDTLLTVERGYEGDAVAHGAGERVEARLTADAMQRLRDLASLPSWEVGDIRTVVKHVELSDDWAPLDGRIIAAADAPVLASMGGVYQVYSPVLRSITTSMVAELDNDLTTVGFYKGYMYECARGGELVIRDMANGYQEANRFTATGSALTTGSVSEVDGRVFFSPGNMGAPLMWSDDGVNFNAGPSIDGGAYFGAVFCKLPEGGYLVGAYSSAGVQVVEVPSTLPAGVAAPTDVYTAPTTNEALAALAKPALDGRFLILPTDGGGSEVLDLHAQNSYPTATEGTLIDVCDVGAIYAVPDVGIKVVGVSDTFELVVRYLVRFNNFGSPLYKQSFCPRLPDTAFVGTTTETGYNAFVINKADPRASMPINDGTGDAPQRFKAAAVYQDRAFVYDTLDTSKQFLFLDEINNPSVPVNTIPTGFSPFDTFDVGLVPESVTGASKGRSPVAYTNTPNGEFAWCRVDEGGDDVLAVVERNSEGEWINRQTVSVPGPSAGAFRPDGLAFFEKGRIAYCGPVDYSSHEFGVLYDNSTGSASAAMEYSDGTVPPPDDITAVVPSSQGFPPVALHNNGDVTFVAINSGSKLSHNSLIPSNTQSEYPTAIRVGRAPLPWPSGANPAAAMYVSATVTRSSSNNSYAYMTLLAKEEGALSIFRLAGIDDMTRLHTVTLLDLKAAIERYNRATGKNFSWPSDIFNPVLLANGDKFLYVYGGEAFIYDIPTRSLEFVRAVGSTTRPYYPVPINGVYFYYGRDGVKSVDALTGEITDWDAGEFYYAGRASSIWTTWLLSDGRLACVFSDSLPSGETGSAYVLTPLEATETDGGFDPETQIYLPEIPTGSDHTLNYVKIR
ncbi:hypothetical protein [Cobetia sp. 1AS1]|uniref:hypothetical protein n=1 Tax=Cobetia sp. 1AS1 TaxID=3040016 RepID=UPI00244CBC99|nr:hypothetical protein [Cobetia sp. 1AS1]MDH2296014.1 hypothetical protein [Cobetia sp. 1AS1]